jgi:hypothetical protein
VKWDDVRRAYPDQWLLIEALEAHSTSDHHRHLDRIAVVEQCMDAGDAYDCYRRIHDQHPHRELYYVHTTRITLDIRERFAAGIRAKLDAHHQA